MGHSVVEITLDGQRRVLDPSGAMVADKAELLFGGAIPGQMVISTVHFVSSG